MTIQEAIRSGKRFKRSKSPVFYFSKDVCNSFTLSSEDLLATDWEVEVVKKELSAEEIRLAIRDSLPKVDQWQYEGLIDRIIKNLGLE